MDRLALSMRSPFMVLVADKIIWVRNPNGINKPSIKTLRKCSNVEVIEGRVPCSFNRYYTRFSNGVLVETGIKKFEHTDLCR